MKISVICASFLGQYEGSTSDREKKFIRSINSFVEQTYPDKELLIVADGCDKTKELYEKKFTKQNNIKLIEIDKQPLFSGNVRQKGIEAATGELICYLDTDDFFGKNHLHNIAGQTQMHGLDWAYFNYFLFLHGHNQVEQAELEHKKIGTSAIAHKKSLDVSWVGCDGYGHDWTFIQKLMEFKNCDKIFGCEYYVGHVRGRLES